MRRAGWLAALLEWTGNHDDVQQVAAVCGGLTHRDQSVCRFPGARQQRGDYDWMTKGDRFAPTLTADFRAVSRDKHLSVVCGSILL